MPAQDHPLNDNFGSTARLATKFFKFTSVANADTFACPMADVKVARLYADGAAAAAYGNVTVGTSSGGVTPLTLYVSATGAYTLEVSGTGV